MAHDILIVDDEADIRLLMSGILDDEGYATRQAGTDAEALAAIDARRPSLVILDIWLQGSQRDGLDILDAVQRDHPEVPVVMISGHGNIETAVGAIRRGAYDYIEKPFKADRLLLIVQRAIEASQLKREIAELRQRSTATASEFIGHSSAAAQLRQAIERVAPTGSRVLISGAPGVGKEVISRLLHANSTRAGGPFVVLNCATLRPEHVEIELFGAEAGATGADSERKVGMLEQAHGGTLLLDEVADMPLETQGKIVRVLQEERFVRVGGSAPVEVDVRVIAATNRVLQDEMSAGGFREDLFYRLNVVPIAVPPLVERREDIPELANYFMARSAESSGLPPRAIGEDAMAALQAYHWPGNVRELRNVIDWILIMAHDTTEDGIVRADMLPAEIGAIAPTALKMGEAGEIMALPLREAREMFERQYLASQVTRFGGNISKTATFVGMERSALHRKLKHLGVQPGEMPAAEGSDAAD